MNVAHCKIIFALEMYLLHKNRFSFTRNLPLSMLNEWRTDCGVNLYDIRNILCITSGFFFSFFFHINQYSGDKYMHILFEMKNKILFIIHGTHNKFLI